MKLSDCTTSKNELVVIARGVVMRGHPSPGGDITSNANVEPVAVDIPVGTVIVVLSVTRTLPLIAKLRVQLVRDGVPGVLHIQAPVSLVRQFAVPVMVPRIPAARVAPS